MSEIHSEQLDSKLSAILQQYEKHQQFIIIKQHKKKTSNTTSKLFSNYKASNYTRKYILKL